MVGVPCPNCGRAKLSIVISDTKVTNSRAVKNGVRRRRECLKCGHRFTTYEVTEDLIAAAPELYEALEIANSMLKNHIGDVEETANRKFINAALAKARGEALKDTQP